MKKTQQECQDLHSALDCLCIADFIVECLLFGVALIALYIVTRRLWRMYQKINYTRQQAKPLYYSKILHWHLCVYLVVFALSIVVACLIYYVILKGESAEMVLALIKVFWMMLYGYITILNLIFTIIAYLFLFKSRDLRHQRESSLQWILFFVAWLLQIFSYVLYIYLVITYTNDPKQSNSKNLLYLRIINLAWSVMCTIALLTIFFLMQRDIYGAAFISYSVKKIEKINVTLLTILHLLRIMVEIFNIFSANTIICGFRELNPQFIDQKPYYAIYLSIANLTLNVIPVFSILRVFKPSKPEFSRSLIFSDYAE